MTTPYFIDEIANSGLVSLYVELPPDLFLDVFGLRSGAFLITNPHFGLVPGGFVSGVVTGTPEAWANLCRAYSGDELIKMIDHHFYTKHRHVWVQQGMV